MERLFSHDAWGTPVGLGLFILMMGLGLGVFFWGVSKISSDDK